ncbi:hypothetical protein SAMN05216251_108237 [Actinacidiphila alni]|uniref:DUF2637 domain-containing protein n=1 Tax=Actinacidiphila alni TaxID=380248 RepID=A0A1I2G5E3_9ACTN|nr:hypothetical protein [Actinacidiphila alni]SFF11851.1 hypothetical protein SAMN05216251_108237 [Actinacidiphila alni]
MDLPMQHRAEARPLTTAQAAVLGTAALAVIGIGGLGAYGTYTNLTTAFPSGTALGAVVAGEGSTFILALVYVGLVMLGQSAPAAVRAGLWALPAVAATVGAVAAHGATSTVVYGLTPLAMVTGAEGAGLLARRIVVRTTGVDVEARRRTAAAVRALAYEQARAERHPDKDVREKAERRAWRLARRVGEGDTALGEQLVDVQRVRLTEGADAALATMFAPAVTRSRDAVTAPVTPALTAAPEQPAELPVEAEPVTPVTEPVAQATPTAQTEDAPTVTLAELAAVAGVTVPVTGQPLSDAHLDVVLRWLRYQTDPPLSYRQAVSAFRVAGFVGAEDRVRRAYAALVARDGDTPTA